MAERKQQPTSDKEDRRQPVPGRRRLLQGGLGASPLLLTLVSRPVLGQNNRCFTPSGFISMPTSEHGQPFTCLGRTPGFWKQEQKFPEWPSPPYWPTTVSGKGGHTATLFNTIFKATPSPYSSTTTFLEVLRHDDLGDGPPHNVARHAVAALLNVHKGWAPVLTADLVKNIWKEYITRGGGTVGYYEPTAGVKWYQDMIVQYLKSTMPL